MKQFTLVVFLFLTLVGSLLCSNAIGQENSDNIDLAPEAPVKIRPMELALHVQQLLDQDKISEARVWYFRGLARSAVENDFAKNYAFEGYTRLVAQNPKSKSISETDITTLETTIKSAIQWELETPIELPEDIEHIDDGQVQVIRENVSEYLLGFVEHTRKERQSALKIDNEIANAGFAYEALEIIPDENKSDIKVQGSVKHPCEKSFSFLGGISMSPAVSNDGKIVAVRTCKKIQILDLTTGEKLKSIDNEDYTVAALSVQASSTDVSVLGLSMRHKPSPKQQTLTFFEINSKSSISFFELPLPVELLNQSNISIARSAYSRDGSMIAMEFCTAEKGCDYNYATYDLNSKKLIWNIENNLGKNTRLISYISEDEDPILVSEIRAEDSSHVGLEYLNLSTGDAVIGSYDHNYQSKKVLGSRVCRLKKNADKSDWPSFSYEIYTPNTNTSIILKEPERARISSCTLSPDGKTLLVASAPYIHRYSFKDE